MKTTEFSKFFGAGILALGLALAPMSLSARAQDATQVPAGGTTVDEDIEQTGEAVENNFDWGWLGLLGLIGLAGLAGKNRDNDNTTRYRDPEVTTRTGYRE